MKKAIDCFFIGQNQIEFQKYEEFVRKQGIQSGAYRDLGINIVHHKSKICSASDIYNMYCSDNNSRKPIKNVEAFNAGIAYLGTYLHRRGYNFDYVNSFQDEKDYLKEQLQQEEVLTIAILTAHYYYTPDPITEIIQFIKNHNSKTRIVVGGPFVSTIIRSFPQPVIDYLFHTIGADFYVNSSQGEAALINIIDALKNNLPFDKINNIYYKTGNGYQATPLQREDNKLSANMVKWDLFTQRAGEFANVRTAISCPFSCAFCAFPQHAGKYQTAEVNALEQELNGLDKIETLKAVFFIDDTFNIPGKRFKNILRMMIKNQYSFKWSSFFRCQEVDRETVELMKESGCELVLLGLESGSERILKNMNKAIPIEKYYRGISLFKELGIITCGNFIIGFPGETDETVQETVEFIKKSGLDFRRTQSWYYDHITPIAEEKDKFNMKGESFQWSHNTMDSQRVGDIIEEIILSLEKPVRWPQYYFEWPNIYQLKHKGVTFDQVKRFLKCFDDGVKERLKDPNQKEVSSEIIRKIKESCQ